MAGLGDRLLDPQYIPDTSKYNPSNVFYTKTNACPVTFTNDPIEYIEGYLKYRLRKFQKDVIIDLFEKDEKGYPIRDVSTLIIGMRCLGIGTEVLMYDGSLKKIEDIKIDDLVMGPDSSPRKVLEISRGISNLYKVKQSCAIDYIINENHVLSLKKATSSKSNTFKTKSGEGTYNRYPNDPDIINIPIRDYTEKSKKWKYFYRGYKAGLLSFSTKEIPIDPYLLGVWLGDGTESQLEITSMDKEIEEWLINYCNDTKARLSIRGKKNTVASTYRICFNSDLGLKGRPFLRKNKLWEEFKKLNLVKNKHIPQVYITNSKEIRLKILAGLIDTDGCYVNHGYEITLANKKLAYDVKRLADTLGYRTNIREKETTCDYNNFVGKAWRLSIHGSIWEIPCLIKRKQYKQTGKISNKEDGLSSIQIQNAGIGEYAGIMVDGDHLFCLSDGTVTHNSGKSLIGSVIGSFLLHQLLSKDDPAQSLGQIPHYRLSAGFIANSEQQSKQTAYASFMNIVETTPWWRKYIQWLLDREATEGSETLFQKHQRRVFFPEKNLEVLSLHSNSQSIAGLTAFFMSFEELSRADVAQGQVQEQTEKRTAQAIFFTASRAVKTLHPFSKIVVTTSPMYETDFGMQLLYQSKDFKGGKHRNAIELLRQKYYPEKVDRMIAYNYTTYEAHPLTPEDPTGYTEASFDQEKKTNYLAYMRDFEAYPPNAISPFFDLPERIERCVINNKEPVAIFENSNFEETIQTGMGVEIRRYVGKKFYPTMTDKTQPYFICCDQGAVKDSFVVAMGHGEESPVEIPNTSGKIEKIKRFRIIIDFVEVWKPDKLQRITVSFQNVEEVIRSIGQYFNVRTVVFDQWHSTESIQRLFSEGLHTEKLGATMDMYETLKLLIYSGMVELPKNDLLISELRQLNVVKGSGGNMKIDHPADGSKDTADAVCRVVWQVYNDSIRRGIQSNFILPVTQRFTTVRDAGKYFQAVRMLDEIPYGGALFGSVTPGSHDLFGQDFIVHENVMGNIPTVK